MINSQVAQVFEEMANLLEITGGDRFRINSFRKVARIIGDQTEDLAAIAERGELQKLSGVGKGTAERIAEFVETGHIQAHQEMLAELPEGLPRLLAIPGVGPKKVHALYNERGIGNLDELKAAIAEGKLDSLSGFGAKTIARISDGINFLERSAGRVPLGVAVRVAEGLRDQVAALPGVRRVEIAGSLRRAKEDVGDIDLLCLANDGAKTIAAFTEFKQVTSVLAKGDTKGAVVVESSHGDSIQVDLRVVPDESFGAAMQYFTGSKEHNIRLREMAVKKGWRLNEYALSEGDKTLAGEDEKGIYESLGLQWIPPELREDRGEIECKGDVPNLLTLDAIRGDLHMHTVDSDGKSTITQMAEAALALGYEYIAITNHSKASVIANGLSVERLLTHIEDVRAVDKAVDGIKIFTGIECDILADGSLDYPDEILAQLDWVVASIHGAQTQPREKVTRRTIAAIENPYVCALGHPSGRLLGERDEMDIDFDAVIKAAAETGTALEVNASWKRLDLKDIRVRQAMAAGCYVVVNTDAHDAEHLPFITMGVQTARRGWATCDRVLNTFTVGELSQWLADRRG